MPVAQFFTAADIRRLAQEPGGHYLLLAPDDRITPEALDVARGLGVQVHREGDGSGGAALLPIVGKSARPGRSLVHVKADGIQLTPFAFNVNRPEMNIHVTDVITASHGSPMAAGFMTWGKGSFPWVLNYDEIDFVIDGQLEVRLENQVVIGNPGDVIYIPKGSNIFFGSPSYAKVFYVTFPADWESQK
ncbi:MAG: ethanolamine utilization protein [Anaerolineales bacterium]|nr:ethanolamine utilization protein [Anaerolineales bacterium]